MKWPKVAQGVSFFVLNECFSVPLGREIAKSRTSSVLEFTGGNKNRKIVPVSMLKLQFGNKNGDLDPILLHYGNDWLRIPKGVTLNTPDTKYFANLLLRILRHLQPVADFINRKKIVYL